MHNAEMGEESIVETSYYGVSNGITASLINETDHGSQSSATFANHSWAG